MALGAQIQDEMKAALLGGDRFVGDTLRNLKAAILNEEVASGKRETGLDDAEIEKIIAREVKKRQDSVRMYRENGREDLAEPEEKEIEILSRYLPQQLSEDELRERVKARIASTGATDMRAMGMVIGAVKQDVGNAADGAMLARIVKEELSTN